MSNGRRSLVTGAAGFIGAYARGGLLDGGHELLASTGFIDFYSRLPKEANPAGLVPCSGFRFVEDVLLRAHSVPLLDGIDFVFHPRVTLQEGFARQIEWVRLTPNATHRF